MDDLALVELGEDELATGLSARRSSPRDVDGINALYERTFANEPALVDAHVQFYREAISKVASFIETSPLCVTVQQDQIVGFAVLSDSPTESRNGYLWEEWVKKTYGEDANAGNSLFLQYFVAAREIEQVVMEKVIQTTFDALITLKQIYAFQLKSSIDAGIEEDTDEKVDDADGVAMREKLLQPFNIRFFEPLEAVDTTVPCPFSCSTTLVSRRDAVIPPLFIRIARVEDHDDLVAVFNAQSEVVTELYGEYFIAELIEAQNEENKAIVAEVDGRAVGLMCLTSDVDVNILAQCFDIECFDNLLDPRYMEKVRNQREREIYGFLVKPDYLEGDLVQAAFFDFNFKDFIEQLPSENNASRGEVVFIELQNMSFPPMDEHISIAKCFLRALWQMRWWRRPVGNNTAVPHQLIMSTAKKLVDMNLTTKQKIAKDILDRWDAIEKAFWKVKEADDLREKLLREEREKAEREAMKKAKKGAKSQDKKGVAEAAPEVEEPGATVPVVGVLGLLHALTGKHIEPAAEDAQEESDEVEEDTYVEEPQPEDAVLHIDLASDWMLLMHWWGRISIGTPESMLGMEECRIFLDSVMAEDEEILIAHHESPSWLANVPPFAKDCFCINLFCLDRAVSSRAHCFIHPAFALYPTKNYCVVTQPHTAPRTPLLQGFTLADAKPSNTFSHILFVVHRAAAEQTVPVVRRLKEVDCTVVKKLVEGMPNEKNLVELALKNDTAYVAEFDDQIVAFLSLQSTAADRVEELRKQFHLDNFVLVDQYDTEGFSRLNACVIHPLMERYARDILRQTMRLERSACLSLELDVTDPDENQPLIYKEFLQVAPRQLPGLKKVKREKPEVATFANLEAAASNEEASANAQVSTLSVSILPKKVITDPKIIITARILVVGASSTGLSLLDSLLSNPHLHFASLTLLSPGKLSFDTDSAGARIVAQQVAYNHGELRRIMLPLRVRIIQGRMVALDRTQRCAILPDGSMLPYDYLVITAGLQDDALHQLKIRSWGVDLTEGYSKINGAMSCADPSLTHLLVEGGKFIKSLIWNPLSYAVVYGRSLDAYCVVQGLLTRKVPAPKILLVLPPKQSVNASSTDAFHNEEVETTIHGILTKMGIKVHDGYQLLTLQCDNRDRLKSLILKDLQPERQPVEGTGKGTMESCPDGEDLRSLSCRILITADTTTADPDIFNAVHNNGLVYDGRLIVDANFCTTDPSIYAAGSLCEFTRKYRGIPDFSLRHDQYNGCEVGEKVAHALLRILDPASHSDDAALPHFCAPLARGGLLPGYLHYYHIKSCLGSNAVRHIMTNTLNVLDMEGQYVTVQINNLGKVDSITFLGYDELEIDSLWGLVGLSEGFFNNLYDRWAAGSVPDVIEFLVDNWASAYFHDRFRDFCSLRGEVHEDLVSLIDNVYESRDWGGVTPNLMKSIQAKVPKETVQKIQDCLVEYLRVSRNHLQDYFLPELCSVGK